MLIVTAKMKIKPGTEKIFLEKTKPLIEGSRAEMGCIGYGLYKSTEEDNTFMMVEQWQNQEIFDKHAASAHFKQFGADAGPLFAAELDIKVYSVSE
ncbi:MAG: antibiotic biosynthesis monooxygenase [Methanimicrococcus sp.]|nr:antibiotic biosynthesis monooxygenase [Methanimicrococcus sp.]